MPRNVLIAQLVAIAVATLFLTVPADQAHAKRNCANVAIRYPDGTVYTRTSRVTAVNVGCRTARRIVKIYLSRAEGNAGPRPRPRGYRCNLVGNAGRCAKGNRSVMWRHPSMGRVIAARRCAGFRLRGQPRSPVHVENMRCARGRRIAIRFARSRRLPRGWMGLNPAGCEWVIFRKRDRRAITGNGYRPPGNQPLVSTTRYRGCNS